ncbi:MAG TPA: class I SAM-dependent methyltransferase [Pedococcus sp.]
MRVSTTEQLMELLDQLYAAGADRTSAAAGEFWDGLFEQEGHPLTSDLPDAGLVAWRAEGLLPAGGGRRALDLGCGLGRNARWLAAQGYAVTGVDIAPRAVERARSLAGDGVTFHVRDAVREPVPGGPFDLVYDSGCFHHLAPHRRITYLTMLAENLSPAGLFGICTFAAGRMGTTREDAELLLRGDLEGGVGYSLKELAEVFGSLELLDARAMPPAEAVGEPAFSHDFLQVALFRRR